MEKITKQLRWLLASLMLVVGMSSAWAEDAVYSTCLFGSNYNSQGVSSYTSTWTATNSDFTWSITNGNNNNNGWSYVKFGRKNNTSVGSITTSDTYSEAITKVDVTIDALTASKVNSIKLYTSTDNSSWTEAGSFSKATGTQSLSLASPTKNLYYKIEFDCESGSSNGLITVSKVEYYYNPSGTVSPSISADDVSIVYNSTSGYIDYTINNSVTGGALSATTTADWLAIGTVGTNVPFTCEANENGERTATVVLTYSYGSESVTKNVFVTQAGNPNAPGTENNPYTVALAREAIDAGTGLTNVYATGIVSAIPTAWSTQHQNITFNFVDNDGDSDYLQAYRCVSTTDADASTIAVGDIVVVKGNLTKYNNTTYEFGAGCQLVSLTHPAVAVEAPTFSPAAGTYSEAQDVTITCATEGASIYYTLDGTDPTTSSTSYSGPVTISTTTTLKAIATDGTNVSEITSATYTIDTRTETHIRFTQGDDGLDYPSGSDFTITVGEAFTSPEAWVTLPSGVYLTKSAARPYLSYSGDNDEVATVNSETGAITLVSGATGTITVTASFTGTDDYKPCTGYYTLKVKPEEVTPTGTGDEITHDFVGVTGTNYTEWSDKEGTSGAVYAGNTAGGPSNANPCVQLRSNNNNSGIVTTTSGGKVTLVTVEWNSSTSSSRTLDIYGSNEPYTSAADLYNSDSQGTKLGSICIDDATQLAITGDYAYIGIRSNNGAIYCDKITIYWDDPNDQRIATTTTFDGEESYTITFGDNFNSPTATLNPATAGTLTYESSNENVATVAADDGVVTIIAAGTTTITATFAGNNDYKPSSASYTLTVNQASVEGDYVKVESANDLTDGQYLIVYESEEGNLAFDGSLEILDANQNTIEVEIENNTILSTPTIDASSFFIVVNDGTIKSASGYYIGQTTDANGLKASLTTEYENSISIDADSNADITSGGAYLRFNKDNGQRFRYYKSSTYTQQQVIALYKKSGTPDTRTATTVTLDPTTTSYNVILGDAFTAPTATLDPAAAGTLTYESSDPTVATVDANGAVEILAAGTTTITAKFAGNDDYKPSKASYTLTVTESAVVYTSLKELQDNVTNTSQDFTLQMLVDVYVTGVKGTNNAYISDGTYGALIYTNNHGLEVGQKLNGTLTAKFVLYKGATEITNFNTTGLTISEGTMAPWIRTIGDITVANQSAFVTFENVTYDATAKTFSDGMNSIAYYDNFGVNPTLEDGHVYNITGIIVMYNNLQIAPLAADDVVDVTPVTVELFDTQDCYKTLETPYDVDLTNSDLEAYIVTLNAEQNYATFVSVTIIPAETPVILHAATEGTYTLTRAALGASLDDVTDNELKVSDGTVTGDAKTIYVLNKRDNEIGFYLLNNGKTLAEGKCYLQIEKSNGAKFIGFHFEGEATDIAELESANDKLQGTTYNLAGQRVTTPAHGLYIVNGKKVLIK